MRLTAFTDYTLRVLLYLAERRQAVVTVQHIAESQGVSHNHLTKVVHALGQAGLVETMRGRGGGLRLRVEPADIRVGAVVRMAEPDFFMAECFDPEGRSCASAPACGLKQLLARATQAFLAELDAVTLEQLMARPEGAQPLHWLEPRTIARLSPMR